MLIRRKVLTLSASLNASPSIPSQGSHEDANNTSLPAGLTPNRGMSSMTNNNVKTLVKKKFVSVKRTSFSSLVVPRGTLCTTKENVGSKYLLPTEKLPHHQHQEQTVIRGFPSVKPPHQQHIVVQRVSLVGGMSSSSVFEKKFQRPSLMRRAYNKQADLALQQCSLGQKRRLDSMSKIFARAGRPLCYKLPHSDVPSAPACENSDSENDDDETNIESDKPFEPLEVWKSPHSGGKLIGLPSQSIREKRFDEFGIEEEVTVLKPAALHLYSRNSVFVPESAAKWLRPHQREGVKFMYECVMGLRDFEGYGCILADDMGLGKTLQSVSLIYTLIKTGITADNLPTAKRVIVVCPCSLVKNWENEFTKWLGIDPAIKTEALADQSRKEVEKSIDSFCKTRLKNILIASYECIRMHIDRFKKYKDCCDLLVCDEAHRLKNSDNQTSRALNGLPVKRRVLLTGTPMQNDLQEFYAMVDFTNPMILGTPEEFRRKMLFPILRGREPDATEKQKQKMMEIQNDISTIVNDFILRRINTLNAQHLPPKLVQVVCCKLTDIQMNMYQHLINSKDTQHLLDGKQANCLTAIQLLMKLSNHPSLAAEDDRLFGNNSSININSSRRSSACKPIKYNDDAEKETLSVPGADGIARFLPSVSGCGRNSAFEPVHPEWSGKMYVLYRLMKEMRKPGNGNDKIVIISNYTQTLDLIGRMCRECNWGFCRLDGSVSMKKRQRMVEDFNDPSSSLIAFLLSSKAGGCGLNLIGGNRLVLFDPDWNPAVDKQAAARCWRDGQKKRCFTYRFLATGTVEEKIFQRQLSKEGLQSVVDDKEQVNSLSTKDLRNLFKLRADTPSDTHDKLRCERCKIIQDNAEIEATKALPKKLSTCENLLAELISSYDESKYFQHPLDPTIHGRTKEDYEQTVKQPIDFETILKKLKQPLASIGSYKNITTFSKDVNRVFNNVLKVWAPGDDIADAARRLQAVWIEKWTNLVPILMSMKCTDDVIEQGQSTKNSEKNENSLEEMFCSKVNNERSDDYQEQIGMPDEENMRHWSHHYSTDTVDDPIFRAAMRGTDAVSFVFGLEVTWSLIQERQQQEEERMAMEAMESIQEDDEGGTEDESEIESKPAADPTKSKQRSCLGSTDLCTRNEAENLVIDSNEYEGVIIDETDQSDMNKPCTETEGIIIDDTDQSDVNEPCTETVSPFKKKLTRTNPKKPRIIDEIPIRVISSTETSDYSNSDDDDQVVDSLGKRRRVNSDHFGASDRETDTNDDCNTYCTNKERISKDPPVDISDVNDEKISIKSPSKQISLIQWSCISCTFLNEDAVRMCVVCKARRPRTSISSQSSKKK